MGGVTGSANSSFRPEPCVSTADTPHRHFDRSRASARRSGETSSPWGREVSPLRQAQGRLLRAARSGRNDEGGVARQERHYATQEVVRVHSGAFGRVSRSRRMERNLVRDAFSMAAAVVVILAGILGGMTWIIDSKLSPVKETAIENENSLAEVSAQIRGVGRFLDRIETAFKIHEGAQGRLRPQPVCRGLIAVEMTGATLTPARRPRPAGRSCGAGPARHGSR